MCSEAGMQRIDMAAADGGIMKTKGEWALTQVLASGFVAHPGA